MPYIITTIPAPGAFHDNGSPVFETRTAVATLDEADLYLQRLDQWQSVDVRDLPAEGGTVGPLPDGTVIEMRPASWMDLKIHTDLPGDPHGTLSDAQILAAFNGAHA